MDGGVSEVTDQWGLLATCILVAQCLNMLSDVGVFLNVRLVL